jgi:deoxyribodipyrimidine photolyase-related protein
MSDYCAGCRYDPKRLIEEDACPFNALYWDFLGRNEAAFDENPRMSLVMKNWASRDAKWKASVRVKASAIRNRLRRGEPL